MRKLTSNVHGPLSLRLVKTAHSQQIGERRNSALDMSKFEQNWACACRIIQRTMKDNAHRQTILVVDDQDDIRNVVRRLLESAGYTVIVADDGAIGLAAFRQNRTAIALVLTDVTMPNMNGLDLADRVLELDAKLPVLFMTGNDSYPDRGYGCVSKPFKGRELLDSVEAVLERPAS